MASPRNLKSVAAVAISYQASNVQIGEFSLWEILYRHYSPEADILLIIKYRGLPPQIWERKESVDQKIDPHQPVPQQQSQA